jgi:hypothetical protein
LSERFRGLVLGPSFLHFYPNYPNDEVIYCPVYEVAMELDVPIVFPSYWTLPTTTLKYGHPSLCDDVAVTFSGLYLVIDATGWGLFEHAFVVACKNPNVHLTSGICPALQRGGLFERHLATLKASCMPLDRLLFVGEHPLVYAARSRCVIQQCDFSPEAGRVLALNGAHFRSMIVGPYGTFLARSGIEKDEVTHADLSPELVADMRNRLGYHRDPRPYFYQRLVERGPGASARGPHIGGSGGRAVVCLAGQPAFTLLTPA